MKREKPGATTIVAVTLLLVLGMMTPLAVSPPGAYAEPEAPEWVWSPQVSGTYQDIFAISAYDENNVWAVGGTMPDPPALLTSDGVSSADAVNASETATGVILYYNGSTWIEQYAHTDYCLLGISAVAPDNVWAVGGRPGYVPGGAGSVVLHFDGTEWSVAYSEDDISMMSVSALAIDDVWVSGGMGIYHWDGNTWTDQLPPSPEPPLVTGISAVDSSNVWASERHRGPGLSHIYYYDGADWDSHTWDTTNLNGVFALDTSNIWVVGDNGTILYWDADRELPDPEVQASGTTENLFGITAIAADNAWAVGDSGTILHWNGSEWAAEASGTGVDLKGVTSIAGDHVWAVGEGGTILMGTWSAEDEPSAFYFAEGYTGAGFQEYLALGNPNAEDATARVTYMLPDGAKDPVEYTIPANSRNTIDVNSELETRWDYVGDVSLKVESEDEIIAERPMYFDYMDKWKGGHDAVGATAPASEWYFAEGYTGYGFEMWVCVLNPSDAPADLTFRFQTQEEDEEIVVGGGTVPANSRRTFLANDLLGGMSYQTSLKLESTAPVVAERPMYFSYQGYGEPKNWQGGHCVMGVTSLEMQYYFAEGTTRSNFEEWVTLQNPNDFDIVVDAVYQLGPDQGDPVEESYDVPARSRYTVFVPNTTDVGKDVSVFLSSEHEFLAERPMYFAYSYVDLSARGGHCVIGAPSPAFEWFLAEGYTGAGFNQWICMQNVENEDATVEIYYYTQEAGALEVRTVPVPANTRSTILVNDHAGPNYQLSTRILVTDGPPIVVERPMYFLFNGVWDGGHDVVGYAP
ncbi:MAG: hypothetical protein PHP28_10510 [Actinomycetota bacterium]|nr:hypothetical protein [Actinomycetota bacterium]MDD5667366.1 hypothetical protein [Actinomycetota bacterium]